VDERYGAQDLLVALTSCELELAESVQAQVTAEESSTFKPSPLWVTYRSAKRSLVATQAPVDDHLGLLDTIIKPTAPQANGVRFLKVFKDWVQPGPQSMGQAALHCVTYLCNML